MSSNQFTVQEALERIINQDAKIEEVVSEIEDATEPENDTAEDPDVQFSSSEEDSQDEFAIDFRSFIRWKHSNTGTTKRGNCNHQVTTVTSKHSKHSNTSKHSNHQEGPWKFKDGIINGHVHLSKAAADCQLPMLSNWFQGLQDSPSLESITYNKHLSSSYHNQL